MFDEDTCAEVRPLQPSSFTHVLRWRALHQPDRLAYTFLADGKNEAAQLTYGDLDHRARNVAASLQSLGTSGRSALLLCPPGQGYLASLFGCFYAGVAAVPAYLPDPAQLQRTLPRLRSVVADSQVGVVLTTTEVQASAQTILSQAAALEPVPWLATDGLQDGRQDNWHEPALTPDSLAMLQYTSGSTRTPRGVMLSHGNLLHNSAMIHRAFLLTPDSVVVIWLPPYHDMGLIGGILQPLYAGCHCVLMPPTAFLRQPALWLQAISRYRGTVSGGPNFAFELCARKVGADERESLDLSSWRVAFNGAEPIRAETLDRFTATFGASGFRPRAFLSCYGLAEATLIVSGSQSDAGPARRTVDKVGLEHNALIDRSPGSRGSQTLVSSGQPLGGQEVAIVDPELSIRTQPGEVGEIWVSGPSIAQGYFGRPEDPAFQGRLDDAGDKRFLRTGDLGFLHDGELYVTGRIKDLIIIRGRNLYPQDIELTVEESHPACRPGSSAAFSVEVDGEERLVVVQELDTRQPANTEDVVFAIRRAVIQVHEVHVYAVLLIEPRSIPKTSSGKIQRHACRTQFIAGSLDVIAASVRGDGDVERQSTGLTRASLLAAAPSQRQSLLETYLREETASALRLPSTKVDPAQTLDSLGIDSVEFTDLMGRLEILLGDSIHVSSALTGSSLSQLAAEVLAQLESYQSSPATVAQPLTEYPLSYGQRALWFLYQMSPQTGAYNIVYAARIAEDLDTVALQRSVDRVVDRHPALRTTFTASGGEPIQHVHEHMPSCFHYEDASLLSEAELRSRLAQEVYYPFDLAHGPLLRVLQLARTPREHILVVAMHHIVSDLWSVALLLHELDILYPAERAGQSVSLEPLNVRYEDYVRRQAELVEGPEGERLWSFWKEQLAGDLPVLNLPTDRPRPTVQTYHGSYQTLRLDADLTRRLEAIARAQGTSLHVALMAAFQVLLYRYSGQEDFLIGCPKMGRNSQWSRLVGYFVNVVPVRARLSGSLTFSALLDRVRAVVASAFAHDAYPFARLAERLQPQRDLSRSPLFQVMFAWQKTTRVIDQQGLAALALSQPGQPLTLGGLSLEAMPLEDRAVPFDMSLLLAPSDGETLGLLEYNADLFDAPTIARMLSHFERLLEALATDPEMPISTLPLLSQAERQLLLVGWNATATNDPPAACIQELCEYQIEQSSDVTALVLASEQRSYREMNQEANRLARRLRGLGVLPGSIVGVCLERCIEIPIALLAILKAGGAYLPLDIDYPRERLAYILADSQAQVVITRQKILDRLPIDGGRYVCLDTDRDLIAQCSDANLSRTATREDPAYLMYTSGSTGEPKGVLVTHGVLADHCRDVRQFYQLTENDRVLLFAALSFDPSIEQILPTFLAGATLVLRGPELLDGRAFNQMLAEYHVTVVNVPPAYWHLWAQAWSEGSELAPNGQLRLVILGGDVVSLESLLLWHASPMRHARLLNAYGPTEATITAATYEIPDCSDTLMIRRRIPIGRPLPNRAMYVLDAYGNPAPIGVPGELHLGGSGLALGYLNRPDLTSERFIPDPFLGRPGDRMYRTGDLARYLADGNIEFLGRIDDQVKVRGIRVELGEIEHALAQHPDVRQAAVLLRPADDPSRPMPTQMAGDHLVSRQENRLIAYVVPSTGATLSVDDLQRFLRERLPGPLLPSAFVMLSSLPLNASGKVDRRALQAVELIPAPLETQFVAPRTPVEEELARIWADVLGVDRVGIHDNFFALGGHSLIATRLVSQIRDRFGVELPLRSLFESSTVADMTIAIAQQQAAQIDSADAERLLDELEAMTAEQARRSMEDSVS